MNNIFEIVKYILVYSDKNNIKDCTNKKLQKLLYYIQAWSLAFRGRTIFNEKIEAWLHGPVVPNVYHHFKNFGYQPVNIKDKEKNFSLSEDDQHLINSVLITYAKYDADYLEMRSHSETPWIEARQKEDKIITNESMENYYKHILETCKNAQ